MSSPSPDTSRGKRDATKSLHMLEIIVGSLVHCSLIIIRPYKLQHQIRTVHLIAARSIQARLTQWREEIFLFRETAANTGAPEIRRCVLPEMRFALPLCLAMLISNSDGCINKSCRKAGVCSKPPHAQLSSFVTALSYWSMG